MYAYVSVCVNYIINYNIYRKKKIVDCVPVKKMSLGRSGIYDVSL